MRELWRRETGYLAQRQNQEVAKSDPRATALPRPALLHPVTLDSTYRTRTITPQDQVGMPPVVLPTAPGSWNSVTPVERRGERAQKN